MSSFLALLCTSTLFMVSTIAATESPPLYARYVIGENYLYAKVSGFESRQSRMHISLDIAWDGSWRDSENHDAAWVFVKGRKTDGSWLHIPINGEISARASDSNNMPEVSVANDQTGFFIYRKAEGAGSNEWRVELSVPMQVEIEEVNAFGLEMVYVTKGPFELGTVKGTRERDRIFVRESGGAPYNPFFTYDKQATSNFGGVYKVDSQESINIGKQDGDLFYVDAQIRGVNTYSGDQKDTLSKAFPKGYSGFYLMKYELTQGQYAAFLNTLTAAQQDSRGLQGTREFGRPMQDYRGTIKRVKNRYIAERPMRAANFLSWRDGLAYSDWAGLRPMTELEFEKAARGPEPAVFLEYVFGINEMGENLSQFELDEVIIAPNGEDGTERINGNYHTTMMKYVDADDVCPSEPDYIACRILSGGDGGRGPLRVGIHAASNPGDRIRSGASYFGVMELSGNLQEPVVSVGHPYGRQFSGGHGDGKLTRNGDADTKDWRAINGEMVFGGRGGSWPYSWNHARVADRFKAYRDNPDRRASHIGWRAARTLSSVSPTP